MTEKFQVTDPENYFSWWQPTTFQTKEDIHSKSNASKSTFTHNSTLQTHQSSVGLQEVDNDPDKNERRLEVIIRVHSAEKYPITVLLLFGLFFLCAMKHLKR